MRIYPVSGGSMAVSEALTSQQILAAQILALGQSYRIAAERVGVTKITITRWVKKPLFKQKVKEFQKEIEDIESNSFKEAAQEVGETIRENVRRILTPDELKAMLSDMAQDLELSPTLRLKAAAQLGKWMGLEAPKPVNDEGKNDYPGKKVEGEDNLKHLSDEEFKKLYLEKMKEAGVNS